MTLPTSYFGGVGSHNLKRSAVPTFYERKDALVGLSFKL